jgi:hypothetical protein
MLSTILLEATQRCWNEDRHKMYNWHGNNPTKYQRMQIENSDAELLRQQSF